MSQEILQVVIDYFTHLMDVKYLLESGNKYWTNK